MIFPKDNPDGKQKRLWLIAIAVLVLVTAAFVYSHFFDFKDIHRHISSYHGVIVFLFMAILPIFGFSIGIVYLVAGAKFGGGWGLALIALATVAHLIGSHWIATSFLRKPIEGWLERKKYHLPHVPDGENVSVSLMTAIIPGLPYFARNYLLALAGIPLKTYFWVCLPIYVLRSSLAILLGDFSEGFTSRKVGLLVAMFVAKVTICAYIIKRLRDKSFKRRKEGARPKADVPPGARAEN
jgi:uncharacterized membrane protein YdjX (TVP38/TMEM64 family)